MSTESVDTDPSIGAPGWQDGGWQDGGWQDGGWQDAAGGAAGWQAPDRDEPTARDSRAWAEDPLTSPSFSQPGTYAADSRSYRGSHTRGAGRREEPGDGSDSSYGHGRDYRAAPPWADSYGSGHADAWRGADHGYPSGRLDPLPDSAAEPDDGWYSASTSPGGTASRRQPPHESWAGREAGYDDDARHDPYTEPGRPSWPDHRESARYDRSGYDAGPGRSPASSGYHGSTGYHPAHGGYGQPGYGSGEAGHRPSEYGPPVTGYDLPDYGRGYQRPGHNLPDADYGLPAYGSAGSHGSIGQGSGHGRYPGYDADRR